MKGRVPSYVREIANQIEQARQGGIVPVHIFKKFGQVLVQILAGFLPLAPHAYSFNNFVLLGNIKHFMFEEKLELLFRQH